MSARHMATFAVALFTLIAGNTSAQHIVPSALLTIDQNRATVVDRIVNQWGDRLAGSKAGITSVQLREILAGLRADHLLAASLAGSVEGLRDVVSGALVRTDAAVSPGLMHTKSLGDTGDDLVYTPIVPCRILDTRNGTTPPYNAPLMGGSAFPVAASLSNFASQGGGDGDCNLPPSSSPIAAIAVTLTVLNPNFDALLAASRASDFATLMQSVVMDFSANKGLANTAIVPVDGTVKFYLGIPNQVSTNVIADAVGYFRRPTNYGGTHTITGLYATDSGGFGNTASGNYSTVGGGQSNTATGDNSAVGGGSNNMASSGGVIAGGSNNSASTGGAFIGGGASNTASFGGFVGAGGGNTAINGSVVGGGANNTARNQSVVGGGTNNTAFAAQHSTIGGGFQNTVTGNYSTVGGGFGNMASGDDSAVGGGIANQATAQYSTVLGGSGNTASGLVSVVMGAGNVASGPHSIVVGGMANTAGGDTSLAGGNGARANENGMFVWSDLQDFFFDPTTFRSAGQSLNTFNVRATGTAGVAFVTGIDITGAPTWGCYTQSGSGWSCTSDRNVKRNLQRVDAQAALAKVAAMPIYNWQPKDGPNMDIRHVGPMAQDFHVAFGLGDSDKSIGMQDVEGVALAAIQGLHEQLTQKSREIARLTAKVGELDTLKRKLQAVEARLGM